MPLIPLMFKGIVWVGTGLMGFDFIHEVYVHVNAYWYGVPKPNYNLIGIVVFMLFIITVCATYLLSRFQVFANIRRFFVDHSANGNFLSRLAALVLIADLVLCAGALYLNVWLFIMVIISLSLTLFRARLRKTLPATIVEHMGPAIYVGWFWTALLFILISQ